MKYMQIASQLYNVPLLITPEKLGAIMTVLSNRADFPVQEAADLELSADLVASAAVPGKRKVQSAAAGIAVISVIGSLVHRGGGFFSSSSGLRSYQAIRHDLKAAVEDPDIGGIMFDVDSHGGAAAGLFDLVDDIHQARMIKPVYGHANQHAYSAAYGILSACEKVYVSRTSGIGSIGVIMQHVDQSKFNKKLGVKVTHIYSGSHKADFSSHQPLAADVKAAAQAEVAELRKLFADTVDRNRGIKSGTALATEAGVFSGEAGVKAGLADEIKTWDEALVELVNATKEKGAVGGLRSEVGGEEPQTENQQPGTEQSKETRNFNGGSNMTTQERFQALIEGNEDAGAALTALGYVNQEAAESAATAAVDQQTTDAAQAATQTATDRAVAIIGLCNESGTPDLAAGLIGSNISLEDAGKKILEEKATIDAKNTINSTLGSGITKEANTFVEHCKNAV